MVAGYARGRDYHYAHRDRMRALRQRLLAMDSGVETYACVDTGVAMEKVWAERAGLGWIGMPFLPWLGALFFLQSFLEYQVKRPLEIGFSGKQVVINSLFKRSYVWTDFNNVVLKDGLLTLDFKNNRLLQKEVVDEEDEDDADEAEFNDYCQIRLKEADKVQH